MADNLSGCSTAKGTPCLWKIPACHKRMLKIKITRKLKIKGQLA